MEVINPEVLRVTQVHRVIRCLGTAPLHRDDYLFGKSQQSEKITTFWSHSWHGGHWKKILTIMIIYSGTPAILLGFLSALVMMLLFCFHLLPGFDRGRYYEWSVWCLGSGVLVVCLVTCLWRSQTQVFFDRICISNNSKLKAEAIVSLAGLLTKSDSMLILWDPTWTERLWCLFELAAFLKCKQNSRKTLLVRPVLLGPVSISLFLSYIAFIVPFLTVPLQPEGLSTFLYPILSGLLLGVLAGYFAVSTLRGYFRDLERMEQQLLSISFDRARCTCCDQNHVSPLGSAMICDRKIVNKCVRRWFGSQQNFEETLRSEVLDILARDLNDRVFCTRWILAVTSPIMWAFMDLVASFAEDFRRPDWWLWTGFAYLLLGPTVWLLVIPSYKDILISVCRVTQARPKNPFLELLKNTAAVFIIFLQPTVVVAIFSFSQVVAPYPLYGWMIFLGGVMVVVTISWLLTRILMPLQRRRVWRPEFGWRFWSRGRMTSC
eukprot:Skav213222  [mRNA]  locus=scaffold369:119199:120668:+ [translate_table: standard]